MKKTQAGRRKDVSMSGDLSEVASSRAWDHIIDAGPRMKSSLMIELDLAPLGLKVDRSGGFSKPKLPPARYLRRDKRAGKDEAG